MKKFLVKFLCFTLTFCLAVSIADAQRKPTKKRTSQKRTTRTTKGSNQKPKITPTDTVAAPLAVSIPPKVDSLPFTKVKPSLRPDGAVISDIRDQIPLSYEHLRVDDAVYRHKIWREIDTRERMNLPFRYAAKEDNGEQLFISILLKAIQDTAVTVFDQIDDRFTTPLTISQVAESLGGGKVDSVPHYDKDGLVDRYDLKTREINLDSIFKFKIKEEVIFDKESSRLFWRILGIAPVINVYNNATGELMGSRDLFWVYYPDLRPTLAKYEVYNPKNFGARMTWEELFESRMFTARIIKSTIDNPFDLPIGAQPGMKDKNGVDNGVFQLWEGERIKEKIFNYEQDLWSY